MPSQPGCSLVVPPAVDRAMRDHGRAAFPDECCGALLGGGRHVRAAWRLANATTEGPGRRFLVRPAEYRWAERQARLAGLDLLGFYHSHPGHPAVPSQYDLDHAWPSFSYIIVSVMNGEAVDVRSWRLSDDRSTLIEEPIILTPDPCP